MQKELDEERADFAKKIQSAREEIQNLYDMLNHQKAKTDHLLAEKEKVS